MPPRVLASGPKPCGGNKYTPIFKTARCEKDLKDNKHDSLHLGRKYARIHVYLSLDIICSSKPTVFLELRSRKTVRFSEQIMSADKFPSKFSPQMEAIVYLLLIIIIITRFAYDLNKR